MQVEPRDGLQPSAPLLFMGIHKSLCSLVHWNC